jgi:hypothetical protein
VYQNYHSIENDVQNDGHVWKKWRTNQSSSYITKRHSDNKLFTKVIRQFTGKIQNQNHHIKKIKELNQNVRHETTVLTQFLKEMEILSKKIKKTILSQKTILFQNKFPYFYIYMICIY